MGKPKNKRKKLPEDAKIGQGNDAPTLSQDLTVTFLVKPSARKDRLYFEGDRGFVDIDAPPVKGKANQAIINFLSKELQIPKSNIVLKRGHKSHEKTFQFLSTQLTLESLKVKYRMK